MDNPLKKIEDILLAVDVQNAALLVLLIEKGVFTLEEFIDAQDRVKPSVIKRGAEMKKEYEMSTQKL